VLRQIFSDKLFCVTYLTQIKCVYLFNTLISGFVFWVISLSLFASDSHWSFFCVSRNEI